MSWSDIASGLLFVFIPWAFWVTRALMAVRAMEQTLLDMHKHPEETGFGTVGFRGVIEDNSRAIRELSHYISWSVKTQTGKEPPPYMERPK